MALIIDIPRFKTQVISHIYMIAKSLMLHPIPPCSMNLFKPEEEVV